MSTETQQDASTRTIVTQPAEREIAMERIFNAPRERVWAVYTDPELIPRWWGPSQYTTEVDKMDFRVGGEWRFIHRSDDEEYAFRGVYREIVEPERIQQTFEFSGWPGYISVETATFEDHGDGRTGCGPSRCSTRPKSATAWRPPAWRPV